jgi:hypothetical protein
MHRNVLAIALTNQLASIAGTALNEGRNRTNAITFRSA